MEYKKSTKEKEVFSYENAKGQKLWMYRHKYYDGLTGKRKEKKKSGFKTEKAAIKALLEVKAQTLRGVTSYIENDNLTVSQWLDIWYETNQKKWKVTSRKQREMAIRVQMKPLIGHFKLQQLTKSLYQKNFIDVLEEQYKPSTVKLLHNLFKIAINAAVEDERLDRNRFTKVAFKTDDNPQNKANENYLTPDELNLFLQTAKDTENITNYTFLLLIAYTGVRRGEACGLQWQNIDFKNNTITIERTRDSKGARTPKTKNSMRTIKVDKTVMAQLEKYKTWCKATLFAFGNKMSDSSFVFISYQSGEPISDSALLYMTRRIIEKANLPEITLHGLRHTHCTILLNKGVNVKVIAERLGNTPAMIYEVYGHVLKELEEETVQIFSDTVGADFGAKK